ncbi:MAG TPA: PAS domain-containing protein, partial [Bacteroidota bacterium]|nr:PAS domain-containing protein [Bacteroidota bacterium]
MPKETKTKAELLKELKGLRRRITRLEKAEAKQSQERILLRTLIDNLPDAIYAKDRLGRKTLANMVDVHNLGYEAETDLLGKDDTAFFSREVAAAFMADDRSVLETGQPVLNREEFFFDKEGKKRWLMTTKVPVRDKNDVIIGLVGIGRDITAHRMAEEAVLRERSLLRTVVDNIPDLIYYKDAEGRYMLNNKAHLSSLGVKDQAELLGQTSFEFNPEEFAEQYWYDESEIMRSGTPLLEKEETAVHRSTGQKRVHLTSKIPVYDDAGHPLGIVGISRDITDRKCSEQELRREKGLMDALMDSLPDSIYFKDRQCRLLRISRKMMRDLGFTRPEEAFGKTDVDLFGEEFGRVTLESDRRLMSEVKPIVGLTERRQKEDGSVV